MTRLLKVEEGFGALRLPFVIDSVMPTSPAKGLLQHGDHIIGVDSLVCSDIAEVQQALQARKGHEVQLLIDRSGSQIAQRIQLDTLGNIGVLLQSAEHLYPIEHVSYNILSAVPAGIDRAIQTTSSYISGLKYIFTREGARQMGGLGTMGKLFPSSLAELLVDHGLPLDYPRSDEYPSHPSARWWAHPLHHHRDDS